MQTHSLTTYTHPQNDPKHAKTKSQKHIQCHTNNSLDLY